ncbi:hypothetical protein CHS0354_039517 [Potamilus streckersoni]|uniref:Meiosis-specific with OB domain-containing protein n=1 Tax=Potamilus streckersoni TaxID=2493646 RepID=A0AAE0TKZ5_9BIVA|nr:hypothetical protein CHS0354_039517 [Potamilus streckersoni]
MAWLALPNVQGMSSNNNLFTNNAKRDVTNRSRSITKLETLMPGMLTVNVVGVIIAKEGQKSIFSRKNPGTERHLVSFIVRDSPTAFVHITCWGGEMYITDLARTFRIGDVVEINNAQVQANSYDSSDDKFRAWTPVPFHLNASENHSSISIYGGYDISQYQSLMNLPTKPSNDYYTLEDVIANGESLHGEHINLLAAVRKVGPVKDITTKSGKHTKRCEIILFDETYQSFPLILWGDDLVDYACTWIPMETVVFAVAVRISHDTFRSAMTATADSKTIITVNPDTVEAHSLYQYAKTQDFGLDEDAAKENNDPPLDQIHEVFTVEQVLSKKQISATYGILYATLTQFNMDADDTSGFFFHGCPRCKKRVYPDNGYQCTNQECVEGALSMFTSGDGVGSGQQQPCLDFSIPITFSDHTGSIPCRFSGPVMQELIGWDVNEVVKLDSIKRTQIKWNFLLERCKVYIKVFRTFKEPEKVSVRVLSCTRAKPADVMSASFISV